MSRDDFARRLVVAVDASQYGSRDDMGHISVQNGLLAVLDRAAAESGLERALWDKQSSGDGELAVLPPTEPEARVIDDFVRELVIAVRQYNRERLPESALRLRIAIHHGNVIRARNGYAGQGVVVVSRLVESAALKDLMSNEEVFLGLAVSDRVYQDVIVQHHSSYDPGEFQRVEVHNKEYRDFAWLWASRKPVTNVSTGGRANRSSETRLAALEKGAGAGDTPLRGSGAGTRWTSTPIIRSRKIWLIAVAIFVLATLTIPVSRELLPKDLQPTAPATTGFGAPMTDAGGSNTTTGSIATADGTTGSQFAAVPLSTLLTPQPGQKAVTVSGQVIAGAATYVLSPKGCPASSLKVSANLRSQFKELRLNVAVDDHADASVRAQFVVLIDATEVRRFVLAPSDSQSLDIPVSEGELLEILIETLGQGDCEDGPYPIAFSEGLAFRQ